MGKDLALDHYGRFYELSLNLALFDHDVFGVCLDYYGSEKHTTSNIECGAGTLTWKRITLGRTKAIGLHYYYKEILKTIEIFKPEIILSASDCYHVILGGYLSKRFGITHIVDLYDNLESYGASKIPFIRTLFRKSVSRAAIVFCVSKPLTNYTYRTCKLTDKPITLTNGVNHSSFRPLDKHTCRKLFGLPSKKTFIGTGGAISKNRGIEILFDAFKKLSRDDNSIILVLCGPISDGIQIPKNKRIQYLGELDSELMPHFYNSLDIGVICNLDTDFGQYCHPQKYVEMAACEISIVASNVGVMKTLLSHCPNALFTPGSTEQLASALKWQMYNNCKTITPVPDWVDQAKIIDTELRKIQKTTPTK